MKKLLPLILVFILLFTACSGGNEETTVADIPEEKMLDKFTVLNVAPILSEAIKRVNSDRPISTMILE